MVVDLDLTEEIVDSFNKCVKSGDYKPFLKDNQKFLRSLGDELGKVKFEKNSKYEWISKDFSYCLKYLSKFDPKKPNEKIAGVGKLEKNVPEVSRDIKDGISRKDWSDFYSKYRPIADHMIYEARKQKIIDFTISFGSGGYGSFATRDEVSGYMNEEVVQLPPQTNVHSKEFKNSGAMVQYDREPEVRTTPWTVTTNRITQKSPDHKLQRKDNEVKTTYFSAATSQMSTGSMGQKSPSRTNRSAAQNRENSAEPTSGSSKKGIGKKLSGLFKKSDNEKPEKTEPHNKSKLTKQQDYEGIKLTSGHNQQNHLDERPTSLHNESRANNNSFKQGSFNDVPSRHAGLSYEDPIVQFRQTSLNRDSPDLDNSAFEQQLYEQKLRNSRHLEEVRAERRRKQAEFEKELQKMRAESKKRFEILLACILMKHRFEEQEQNWKDWIQGCRNHIVELCNRCADFVYDVPRNHGGFRKPEKVDHEDFNSDKGLLLGKTLMTFNAIQFDFEHLKSVEEKYPDALFVRVLQNCLVKTAHTVLDVYTSLQNFGPNKNDFQDFQDLIATLTPNMIYSTTDLHRICSGDVTGKYENFQFPDFPQSVNVQEVL